MRLTLTRSHPQCVSLKAPRGYYLLFANWIAGSPSIGFKIEVENQAHRAKKKEGAENYERTP